MLFRSALLAGAVGLVAASSHYNPIRSKHHERLARRQDTSVDVDVSVDASVTGAGDVEEVELVASAWYAEWHSQFVTLDQVAWDKYTHLYYAFKVSTEDPSDVTLPDADAQLLPQFVAKAHENDVKALISVGGWAGSIYFSRNVGDETNRTKFANALTEFVQTYELDGIDFDWEYPGRQGLGCNTISPNDTANFLTFLQQLKSNSSFLITSAVSISPFADETGNPSSDVSGFADVFDWIEIMNYDVWGAWSDFVGPNAPLNDTCIEDEDKRVGSAVSAVEAWTSAGIPKHKIVLGVPSYGHAFAVNASDALVDGEEEIAAYPPFTGRGLGDAWSDSAGVDQCGNDQPAGDTWNFWSLIDSGLLVQNGTTASPGVPYRFDECSQTEYVYVDAASALISYDGPRSFAAKGEFVKNEGLRGFALWEVAGDADDILLDSIRSAGGFNDDDNADADVDEEDLPIC